MSLRTKLVLALSLLSAFAAITIGAFSYRAKSSRTVWISRGSPIFRRK